MAITDVFSKFVVAAPTVIWCTNCLGTMQSLWYQEDKNYKFLPSRKWNNQKNDPKNKTLLRTLNEKEKNNLPDHQTELPVIYNSTGRATTGYCPCFIVHGTESQLPTDFMLNRTDDDDDVEVDQWLNITRQTCVRR